VLQPSAREAAGSPPGERLDLQDLVEDYERRLVRTALRRTGGVQKRAAELLRMKPTTLHEIIKRLEIQSREN
jgi:transcriptional regulator with GAF, ATPase, and Fis domain